MPNAARPAKKQLTEEGIVSRQAVVTNAPALLTVTDKYGKAIDPSILRTTEGEMPGSFGSGKSSLQQARFRSVEFGDITAVATMPYNPTLLLAATALAQTNQKLDAIQATVDQMLDYMRQHDTSELRDDLETLADALNGHGINRQSEPRPQNAQMKALDARQYAITKMDPYRGLAAGKPKVRSTPMCTRGVNRDAAAT